MTGIERLRKFAKGCRLIGQNAYSNAIGDIADQIEREQGGRVSRMRVLAVVMEMERHVSGVEGTDDSPVARWARELREALGGDGRDPAADVSVSAYDLLPPEDREAISWVRAHGGLDHVRAEWRSRVPYDLYERRRQRLLGHIAECETALGRRREIISKLGHYVRDLTNENAELRRRAMPDGYEWPTVDGRKVDFKTAYQPSLGVLEAVSIYNNGAVEVMSHDGIIKPVSEIHVVVLAADGLPLREGQTVWDTDAESDTPLTAVEVSSDLVRCEYTWKDGKTYRPCYPPDRLTHTKPEPPDSWERIEEDKGLNPFDYCKKIGHKLWTFDNAEEVKASDLVRRCKALAEKENRNE